MLTRQRVVLELLRQAERPVSKIELMKWCFLLRHDTPSAGGSAFYDFLPYHYGPYSFSLQREVAELVDQGYVKANEDRLQRTDLAVRAGELPTRLTGDVVRVVRRFGQVSTDDLLDHVYDRFPRYTMLSRRKTLVSRPVAEPAVHTAGYEGRQVDGFLWLLLASGIRRLIDVRSNPIARRYGFHKSTLSRLCALLDIDYIHVPELGIPSAERQALDDTPSARDRLFTKYTSVTIPSQEEAVERVARSMTERASVLVCMEAAPCDCHRSRLATVVAHRTGLPVRHLGVDDGRETSR